MITVYQADMFTMETVSFGYTWGITPFCNRVIIVPDEEWDSVKSKLSDISLRTSEIKSMVDSFVLHMSRPDCIGSSTHEFADVTYHKASNVITTMNPITAMMLQIDGEARSV
jgi:hypothetical protein